MVRRGEFVARIGPSGSGKSTLLNIIELLDRPTRGRLFIEGQGTSKLNDTWITKLRSHSIGLVYQYHYLGSAFTAIENVMMPLLVDHAFPTNDMHQRARDLLAQVGLTQWQNNWLVPSKPRAELGAMPARKSTTARIQKTPLDSRPRVCWYNVYKIPNAANLRPLAACRGLPDRITHHSAAPRGFSKSRVFPPWRVTKLR